MDSLSHVHEFSTALDDEIRAARQGKGRRYQIRNGRRVTESYGSHLYLFSVEFEVNIPDDSPIELQVGSIRARGFLVSSDGVTVFIEVEHDLGEVVPRAELCSEPWYLLEALKNRLSEAETLGSSNVNLAAKVLGWMPAEVVCDMHRAERIRRLVASPVNGAQTRALSAALGSEVTIIWGPPGTGKTSTLGLVAFGLYEAGETLLVMGHSNAAVDVATKAIATTMIGVRSLKGGEVIRFGSPRLPELRNFDFVIPRMILKDRYPRLIEQIERAELERRQISNRLRSSASESERERLQASLREGRTWLTNLREEVRSREAELVNGARIVACTLSKAAISPEIYQRRFAAVVVDEASMAYVPQVFFAATLATRRFIGLGDFRQLPPIALANTEASRTWLRRDVFDHAGITERVGRGEEDSRLWLLDTQYRMHPRISAVVNRVVYGGRLKDGPETEIRTSKIAARGPEPGEAVILYDISPLRSRAYREPRGQGFSRFNPVSAAVCFEAACEALEAGAEGVGVITPYSAQARLIHRFAKEFGVDQRIQAATVHRFQGREREVVIFDVVDSRPFDKPGVLIRGGEEHDALRLLNVAMSRAQGKLILVGDFDYLTSRCDPSSPFMAIVREAASVGVKRPIDTEHLKNRGVDAPQAEGSRISWYRERSEALGWLHGDIVGAKWEVVINWPDNRMELLNSDLIARFRSPSVRIVLAGPDTPLLKVIGERHGFQTVSSPVEPEGMVSIDGRIFWILGWLGDFGIKRPTVRIASPAPAAMLGEYTSLRYLLGEVGDPEVAASRGLGPCHCGGCFWIEIAPWGPALKCTSCNRRKRLRPELATRFARIVGIQCAKCAADAVGRQAAEGVFLGCRRYPSCTWTGNLMNFV